jgi:hypothetical protein
MSNETKVTAVEWLVSKVNKQSWGDFRIDIPKEIIEQAQAMEKQQIMKAVEDGFNEACAHPVCVKFLTAEQYYTENYGK